MYFAAPPTPPAPCHPNPCGPNSLCRVNNGQAACSCLPTFVGSPPQCRPECVVSSECASDKSCINQKCVNPCPGTCGSGASCHVINHSPVCSCDVGYTGDPFSKCVPIPERKEHLSSQSHVAYNGKLFITVTNVIFSFLAPKDVIYVNPCIPSPCGPNSMCQAIGTSPSCSCLATFIGSPPNCRPECSINAECSSQLACITSKCRDPCPGSCGINTRCSVINHTPNCVCLEGYTGDPFSSCYPTPPPGKTRFVFVAWDI